MMSLSVRYTPRQAATVLAASVVAAFVFAVSYLVLHVALAEVSVGPARPLSDLDAEISLAAWFSSIQLFVIGAVLFLAASQNHQPDRLSSGLLRFASLGFIFLSVDEAAAIHEKITMAARSAGLGAVMIKGLHGAWIWLYAVIALLILGIAARPIRRLWIHYPREVRIGILGAAVFAAGAIGLEIISYIYLRDGAAGTTSAIYKVEVAAEEFLEMAGASIILYGSLLLADRVSGGPD